MNIGDEGLIVFSQRCIDSWADQGGVAPNPIMHFHDANDACFIPGIRSQKNKLSDFQNDGVRITDGSNYVWLKNSGAIDANSSSEINITAPTVNITGNINHMGNNTQSGNLDVTGAISATVSLTTPLITASSIIVNGVEMDGHTHPYAWTDGGGSGNTGGAQ